MGTVPTGTGELRRIHSRVVWMSGPVDRSITVSDPQRVAQRSFSTSSSTEEVAAELAMLALTFTRKARPMVMGSDSGWFTLAGTIDLPAATSARTVSGSTPSRMATNSISGVTWPLRADVSLVDRGPGLGPRGCERRAVR